MPSQAKPRSRRSGTRTDARRRARQREEAAAAITAAELEDGEDAAPAERRPAPSLLRRLLPEAPPLPDKPDPLANFEYRGPGALRGLAEAAFLLRQNPLAWITPALGWTVARVVPIAVPAIAFLSTTLEFGALIGAGVLGWQRPWLFGAVAAFIGSLIFGGFVIALASSGDVPVPGTTFDLAIGLLSFAALQSLVGGLAGWFGGYWRRRFADASATRRSLQAQRQRRPRR